MFIKDEFSEAAPIEIASSERLIDMRLNQDAMLLNGELEILKAQVNTLKEILAEVIDATVPQGQLLNVCRLYGYREVKSGEF